ncbi:MAG: transposase [Chitinophagaceae bacterium]|nr:transposase [Oligoflexus sp.]
MWEEIKDFAGSMTEVWSKATKLGGVAHYILPHYKKLTAYLDNPIISISNDFSERILRMEKLIQANALFRNSLEGRFALDINRSILQTGIAARAPLQDYVTYVLRASPEDVQSHPENFIALAYSRMNSQLT